ncbi:8851_t:CDS:2 [Diversispora eburnea]|uniref:8851_t:CDS:1 n=1 Tax=Diversispora eburnea TaxID=1213867 RepID=A0A9N8W4D3_9GLOM|nr:8851_t:CDS:2 [Diversispora eburnea]
MTETEEPLTPLEESIPRDSMMRDSVITYSTDVVDSSMIEETQTVDSYSTKDRSADAQGNSINFYRKKRFWGICLAISVVLAAILLPLFFFVIFPAIAQKTINNSNLELTSVNITSPGNTSFILSSTGKVTNGGPFSSTIKFKTPVNMFWEDKVLGTVNFDTINVKGGQAQINLQDKEFLITENDNLVQFSKALITQSTIKMSFKGSVTVKAMGISKGGLTLDKTVILNGVNYFGTPKATEFFVTQPDNNTLALNITVLLNNTSVFSMPMGTVGVAASYNGTLVSNLTVANFDMVPGDIYLKMFGNVSAPQTLEDVKNIGTLMSSILTNTPINTTSTVLYSLPDHVNSVDWISSSVVGLQLTALMGDLPNGPPQLITGLDFGNLALNFTKETSFTPLMTSNNSQVQYQLPYDIKMTMLESSQNISLYFKNYSIATEVTDLFPVNDDGKKSLSLNIPPTILNFTSPDLTQEFLKELTLSSQLTINVTGHVDVVTETCIGNLTIKRLPFTVNSTLEGLSGFQSVPPEVKNISLVGGTKDYLIVQIAVNLTNPANVSLSVGNVSFQIIYNNDIVGIANTSLSLVPGGNDLLFYSTLDPVHNANAAEILKRFMLNQTTIVYQKGYDGSTDVESLKLAMSSLNIPASLPGSSFPMISNASVEITGATLTNVTAQSVVALANPFIAPITILSVNSIITAHGYNLGSISQDRSENPIILPGSGNVTVSDLPFSLNLDPPTMFGLLRTQAQLANLDTTVLDALITIGKVNVPGVPSVTEIDPGKLKNFDMNVFVETALANIVANVSLLSTIRVGEYEMPFAYSQIVTTHTDLSILKLIPILSRPIVQTLVDASIMSFDKILIQKPTEDSFVAVITGQISNTGPLPATISFPNGANLLSDKTVLGTMSLPPITAQDNKAVLSNVQSTFKILNKGALTTFTTNVLLSNSGLWTISADNLTVSALKIDVPGITLQKVVEVKGSNGFKNDIKINNYTLPGDAPDGGISTVIDSTLTNPGSIGVELGTITFDVLSDNVKIGEVSSSDLTVVPAGPTEIKLTGRLIPQTGEGLKVMTKIFAEVLAEKPVPVTTKVVGLNPAISWLVSAASKLSIDSILPPIKLEKIIPSVTIDDMSMNFTLDTAFNPISSSNEIEAEMKIPFGFTLTIQELSEDITLTYENKNIAKLPIPKGPAKMEGKTTIITSYKKIPLQVFDDAHDAFESFVKDLTFAVSTKFGITGTSNALAKTPIGLIPLNGIPIDVQTSLKGLQGLQSAPVILGSPLIISADPKGVLIFLQVTMTNPSKITVGAGDVNFDIHFKGQSMGTTTIKDIVIEPGKKNYDANFLFAPKTPEAIKAGSDLLGNFLTAKKSDLIVLGNSDSTPITSLKSAFESLSLKTFLQIDAPRVLDSVEVTVGLDVLKTKSGLANITIINSLNIGYEITGMEATASFQGKELGKIDVPQALVPTKVGVLSTIHAGGIPITFTGDLTPIIGKSSILVDIDSTVFTNINGFKTPVHLTETDVKTTIIVSKS